MPITRRMRQTNRIPSPFSGSYREKKKRLRRLLDDRNDRRKEHPRRDGLPVNGRFRVVSLRSGRLPGDRQELPHRIRLQRPQPRVNRRPCGARSGVSSRMQVLWPEIGNGSSARNRSEFQPEECRMEGPLRLVLPDPPAQRHPPPAVEEAGAIRNSLSTPRRLRRKKTRRAIF